MACIDARLLDGRYGANTFSLLPHPTVSTVSQLFPVRTALTALTALGRGTSRSAKSGKRGKTLPGLAGGTDWGHSLSQVGPALAFS